MIYYNRSLLLTPKEILAIAKYKLGLTYSEMATESGVLNSAISGIIHNKIKHPNTETYLKLRKLLNLSQLVAPHKAPVQQLAQFAMDKHGTGKAARLVCCTPSMLRYLAKHTQRDCNWIFYANLVWVLRGAPIWVLPESPPGETHATNPRKTMAAGLFSPTRVSPAHKESA